MIRIYVYLEIMYYKGGLMSEEKVGDSDLSHFLRLSHLKLFRNSNYLSVDAQVCENQTK